ncbi:MAG: zeta toxin family protein [Chthoniobacter sp.]|uniref:zeta toxin family protein n=1 Tax=Chthoniobacter sp. TaxID=2510640 RepID=UPI0032ACD6AA
MIDPALDQRPVIVAIAGPNGAGKTTFFHAHLRDAGLRFVNADDIARELDVSPYEAAEIADALRRELVSQRESFVFETVFSDPVGEKLTFLKNAAVTGYTVVLCFIGISTPETSEQRVAMRVTQGGHDVPSEKLSARFPRTMLNLKAAIQTLPIVLVFDNDALASPFRKVAEFRSAKSVFLSDPVPKWLALSTCA